MTGLIFEHRDNIFRAVYLESIPGLDQEDRERLLREYADMYLDEKKEMKIKGKNYEGRLNADGYHVIGCLGGRQFKGVIETDKGKFNLAILIASLIDQSLN